MVGKRIYYFFGVLYVILSVSLFYWLYGVTNMDNNEEILVFTVYLIGACDVAISLVKLVESNFRDKNITISLNFFAIIVVWTIHWCGITERMRNIAGKVSMVLIVILILQMLIDILSPNNK